MEFIRQNVFYVVLVVIVLALAAQSFAEDFILCDLAADSDAARKDAK